MELLVKGMYICRVFSHLYLVQERTNKREKKKGPSVVERYMPDKILTPETFKMAEE